MNLHLDHMEQHPVNSVVPESIEAMDFVPGPVTEFQPGLFQDQLRMEYASAKNKLQQLFSPASEMKQLVEMKEAAMDVKREVDKLLNQQENKVFPEVRSVAGGRLGMVTVMEQDRLLANEYFQSFMEALDTEQALSNLQQACLIILERIRKVENMIFPLMKWH